MSKVIRGVNDLKTWCKENSREDLLKEWDYEKNGELKPCNVAKTSNQKVWWKCSNWHEWKSTINNRTRGCKCPYCSNNLVMSGFNDLKSQNPQLAKDWDYKKNTIKPDEITAHSNKKVWWKCHVCGYEWNATINARSYGNGCPKCSRETHTSFPEQAIYFYIKKYFPDAINSDRTILNGKELDIYIPSIKTAIEYDGNTWHNNKNKQELDEIKNQLCKNIGITLIRVREPKLNDIDNCIVFKRIKDTKYDDLDDVIEKVLKYLDIINLDVNINRDTPKILEQYAAKKTNNSLAACYPEIAKEWHPAKNGNLTPDKVNYGSNKKVWWLGKCGHEWQAVIVSRTVDDRKCPLCSRKDFETWCKENNKENLLKEWNYEKNTINPTDITYGSTKKVWWVCPKGHNWQDTVNARTNNKNKDCPYCKNRRVLIGYNDLKTINPKLIKDWDFEKK